MFMLSWLTLVLSILWRYDASNGAEPNFNETYFERLRNYHVNALPVPEGKYPWIARVVHSRRSMTPHLCTASCLRKQTFITAASCVYLLKVRFTKVIYNKQHLSAKAFVVPSKETKQQYDDIGIIVTKNNEYVGKHWPNTWFLSRSRRDNNFKWLVKSDLEKEVYKIIGYSTPKKHVNARHVEEYTLTELDVVLDMRLCSDILTFDNHRIKGFHVPCYHSCSYELFYHAHESCDNYHGVEGGALHSVQYPRYIYGVATWGAQFKDYELPVGLALTNSKAFKEDYNCSHFIAVDKKEDPPMGYYQKLCDSKIKS